MKRILKYTPIPPNGHTPKVVKGKPIFAAMQNGHVTVWCEEYDEEYAQYEESKLVFVGTGQDYQGDHLFTVEDGPWIWHIIKV